VKDLNEFFFGLFSCSTCLGFYTGLVVFPLIGINITDWYIVDMFLSGLISSGSINIIEHIKIRFGND
jgi:hypothetical protein